MEVIVCMSLLIVLWGNVCRSVWMRYCYLEFLSTGWTVSILRYWRSHLSCILGWSLQPRLLTPGKRFFRITRSGFWPTRLGMVCWGSQWRRTDLLPVIKEEQGSRGRRQRQGLWCPRLKRCRVWPKGWRVPSTCGIMCLIVMLVFDRLVYAKGRFVFPWNR